MHDVPQRRHRKLQMRVVREQRFARRRMRATHHKIVAADYFRGFLLELRQKIPPRIPRKRSERRRVIIVAIRTSVQSR